MSCLTFSLFIQKCYLFFFFFLVHLDILTHLHLNPKKVSFSLHEWSLSLIWPSPIYNLATYMRLVPCLCTPRILLKPATHAPSTEMSTFGRKKQQPCSSRTGSTGKAKITHCKYLCWAGRCQTIFYCYHQFHSSMTGVYISILASSDHSWFLSSHPRLLSSYLQRNSELHNSSWDHLFYFIVIFLWDSQESHHLGNIIWQHSLSFQGEKRHSQSHHPMDYRLLFSA